MKTAIFMTLLSVIGFNTANAEITTTRLSSSDINASHFIRVRSDVVAGRNLRVNGTNSCNITLTSSWDSYNKNATAVIILPNGARLLNARILESTPVVERCTKAYSAEGTNAVQCRLSGIVYNQKITLQARYHQAVSNSEVCKAYLGGER